MELSDTTNPIGIDLLEPIQNLNNNPFPNIFWKSMLKK
jgi:hypothetical protein